MKKADSGHRLPEAALKLIPEKGYPGAGTVSPDGFLLFQD